MTETQEPTQDYIAQRNAFRLFKLQSTSRIEELKKEINDLEKQIEDARPKTLHGISICERCDTKSLVYIGKRKGCTGEDDVYECKICHQNYETYF